MPGRIIFADNPSPYVLKIPYPERIAQAKFKKFVDILKSMHINIPLVSMLEQVPKYAKYLM